MKNILSILLTLSLFAPALSQKKEIKGIKKWQKKLNHEFRTPDESPLDQEDLAEFKKLEFFPIDTKYIVEAKFERTPDETPFKMPTSTDRLPVYVKYGTATFTLEGEEFVLSVYQNESLTQKEGYEDYLFIPFTDDTNGEGSYGGGRYMDVRIPSSDTLILNFNKSYNPYCAYSNRYSCPIPPRENDLAVEIPAGVKAWGDH